MMKPKGCQYITLASTIVAVSCVGSKSETKHTLPNIIFILADDMGWSDLECYGNSFHETPNINNLAADGMRFMQAYAACPVSSPTRASILTGKYPVSVNLTDWIPGRQSNGARDDEKLLGPAINQQLNTEYITLAEKLKTVGYATASIGKWHLGDSGYLPCDQGFDINITGNHKGSPPGFIYPFKRKAGSSFSMLDEKAKEGDILTDILTDYAINYIHQKRDTPFFMYLSYYAVHIPLEAKDSLVEKYTDKAKNTDDSVFTNPVYAAMIETLDNNIGRLTRTLDSLCLSDNTIVVFFSDNGGLSVQEGANTPATINEPLRAGKGHLYEGGIREPLIVKWPGVIKNGEITDEIVSSIDFFTTIMDIVGLEHADIDGKSFLKLLKGDSNFERGPVFWHYPHYSNQGGKPSSAVRTGAYKLIEFFEDGKLELYNIQNDVREKNDLSTELPSKTKEMKDLLDKWRNSVNAKFPEPNPTYKGVE